MLEIPTNVENFHQLASFICDHSDQLTPLIIQAPTGSGKTTLLPQELLKQKKNLRIAILEPRRVAAKWAAEFVSKKFQQKSGELVGYVFQHEKCLSERSQIVYYTEGTFLRMLQNSNILQRIDMLILDEFHERHLASDLVLSLFQLYQTKKVTLPQLIIMSATLSPEAFGSLFPRLKHFQLRTESYPQHLYYPPQDIMWSKRSLISKISWGIEQAWKAPGDMLIFLPGLAEMKECERHLEKFLTTQDCKIHLLHSQKEIPSDLFDIQPYRRVFLATSLAESSVTLPSVRIVIDSGLARQQVYDRKKNLTALHTLPCAQSSCIQRAGRANRLGEGHVYRLFSEDDFKKRKPFQEPEILNLAPQDIFLSLLKCPFPWRDLKWITPPLISELNTLEKQFHDLGLLTSEQKLSSKGHWFLESDLPFQQANLLFEASTRLTAKAWSEFCHILSIQIENQKNYQKKLADKLRALPHVSGSLQTWEGLYVEFQPRTIARRIGEKLFNALGDGYLLAPQLREKIDPKHEFWILLETDEEKKICRDIHLLEKKELLAFAQKSYAKIDISETGQKKQIVKIHYHSLVLEEYSEKVVLEFSDFRSTLIRWREDWLDSQEGLRFQYALKTLSLCADIREDFDWNFWLEYFFQENAPFTNSPQDLFSLQLKTELESHYQIQLEQVAPSLFTTARGKKIPLIYTLHPQAGVSVESFMQDFFGFKQHPQIQGHPLKITLWGPHRRPLAITSDLINFWRGPYQKLRLGLKRDYPKHAWPEDPSSYQGAPKISK
jgi:ATP-dependent helicase HrpB